MPVSRFVALFLALAACSGRSSDDASVATDSGLRSDSAPLEDVFDCRSVPSTVPAMSRLSGPKAGRGIAFDALGNCYGVSEPHLFRSGYQSGAQLFLAELGELDQLEMLPSGNLVLAVSGSESLLRITPGGEQTTLASGIVVYGLRTGPDGNIYAATRDAIYKIDPSTGERVVFVNAVGFSPRVVDFAPDGSWLYIGTEKSQGRVYRVPLGPGLEPLGEPEILATVDGNWHDGLGVDTCGYLYLVDYETSAIYRISPDGGSIKTLYSGDRASYAHGIAWGRGVGGWSEYAIYLPMPGAGDTVGELVVGVPYRTWGGATINRPETH